MIRSALVIAMVLSTAGLAAGKKKEDAPIPYDEQVEEDDKRRDLPKRSEEARDRPEETEVEQQDREISLASDDDPNIGLSGELLIGALLLDSSRGQGVEPFFTGGLRFTWEWSRTLLTDEFWREIFFADVAWFASSSIAGGGPGFAGTSEVKDWVSYHYFTIAEGFALPLGKTPLTVFASLGFGFAYQKSSIMVSNEQTDVASARPVAQYGGGIRGRIGLTSDDKIRLSFRLETTRFRRGYMDDTLVGGSIGVTF